MKNVNKHAKRLVEKLQTVADQPVDDVLDDIKNCAFDTMAECVLGLNVDSERHKTLAESVLKTVETVTEQFVEKISSPWLYWDFMLPLFKSGRRYLHSVNEINRLLRLVVIELRKGLAESEKEEQQNDPLKFISTGRTLLRHHLQDPTFTEEDLRDNLVSIGSAGFDTVAATVLWCFYTLGRNPQEQEKVYEEVQSFVPKGDITFDDLSQMKYLDCFIKETLRLYPTVPMYVRRSSKEIMCGKYKIPKGADVSFFTFMLHRNSDTYPQPEKFDPERFSDSSKIRPWMYIPFAEGYRNCIGKKFAILEIKVQLAHVLRRFKITALDKIDDSDLNWRVVLTPSKPLRFRFETRLPQI